jgi:hypothetical protein
VYMWQVANGICFSSKLSVGGPVQAYYLLMMGYKYNSRCTVNQTYKTNIVNLCLLVHLARMCIKHIAGAVTQPHCNCNMGCANTNVYPVLADDIVKTCDADSNVSL